jgi:hypothetical protein
VLYGVHEVYYERGEPVSLSGIIVSPIGEDKHEFEKSWELFQKAFEKPTLTFNADMNQFI